MCAHWIVQDGDYFWTIEHGSLYGNMLKSFFESYCLSCRLEIIDG